MGIGDGGPEMQHESFDVAEPIITATGIVGERMIPGVVTVPGALGNRDRILVDEKFRIEDFMVLASEPGRG